MGLAHTYHPHCGCAACSRQELADERADELALALHKSGDVLSETLGELTTEQLALIAGHLAQGNDAGAAEILRTAISDYIASEIDRRMDEVGTTKLETVQRMLTVYEAKPAPVAVMPWRVAA
ncbi:MULTISPECIES: hypothetical protein [Xanthomonas]|uniref:Uncharacterized protein n=2 Tax=Xanthomonas TaxID=338 RepID=A0A7Z7J090_XANCH|nr:MULTISPECIES: hypothetical protein [Xanthomonas]ATS39285.1 hypothetical protein XcfCFBP6988P_15085 [Xanthomonas citri pv. phaseoli var. fuscans]ATS41908.1 hypothetical protein XcfCFBP6989P_05405 [Xanthomonas citri pv. phaseoli var. fuscans]ATS47288.1 hypothetical protein XcfCFBP6990P_11955 [Xanthomonas citri pv. phaseoli var. fuscans]ATS86333.1 hypothetical protein XcfCFBP6991P_22275 [Xanthomonas citri pv. phaseoli var. fuscans]QWN20929.1 hypothetical protein DGM98_13020 [Xanthomonas citri]